MNWKQLVNRTLGTGDGYELRRRPAARTAGPRRPHRRLLGSSPRFLRCSRSRRSPARPRRPSGSRQPPDGENGSAARAAHPAGQAKSANFFDDHPRLAMSRRMHMNLRYDALIEQNRDVLEGARVLDLACSEGRTPSVRCTWAGAAHVLGIESREDKVVNANGHFEALGVAADRYRFIAGDVFRTLRHRSAPAVVLVSGTSTTR